MMGVKIKLLGFILLVLLTNAWGTVTLYNPEGSIATYTATIQKGINTCPSGETVEVSHRIYNEAVSIKNKSIALIGEGTPTITTEGLDETNIVKHLRHINK